MNGIRVFLFPALVLVTRSEQDSSAIEAEAIRRVDQALTAWRADPEKDPDQLEKWLVAAGKPASAYLCRIIEGRPQDLPLEPLVMAVGRLGSSESVGTVCSVLSCPAPADRVAAVGALRLLFCSKCIPFLVAAVDDSDDSVAIVAEAALLGEKSSFAQVAREVDKHWKAAKDKSRLARLLGQVATADAHERLLGFLDLPGDDSRVAALQGLYLLARPEDGERVAVLLKGSSSVVVRKQACLFLGRVQHRPAVRELIELLRETEAGLAANAHWALQRITGLKLKLDAGLWDEWWERSGKTLEGLSVR